MNQRLAKQIKRLKELSTKEEVTVSESGEGDQRMVLVRDTDVDAGQSFYRMRVEANTE